MFFEMEEQLSSEAFPSEFKHQQSLNEPIRHLLNQHHHDFRQALTRLYPKPTYSPEFKRLDNSLDILKMKSKEQLEERVDLLLAEQLASTNGCLGEHWQVALHCFIKNLYFERKVRARKYEAILKEYSSLASKIACFDDLITYLQVIFSFNAPALQQEIYGQLSKALSSEESAFKNLLASLNEEERLILEFHHAQLSMSHYNESRQSVEGVFERIMKKLETNPYRRLLSFILESKVKFEIHKLTDLLLKNKLTADYQHNTYTLQAKALHPELQGAQTIKQLLGKLRSKELLKAVCLNSAHVEGKTVKVKFNLEMIQLLLTCIENEYIDRVNDAQSFNSLVNMCKSLLDHHSHQFVSVDGGSLKDEHFNIKYICKLFCIIEKLFNKDESTLASTLTEPLLLKLARTLNDLILYHKLGQQPFIEEAVKSLFVIFFISSLNQTQEINDFPSILEEDSQLSQQVKKLVLVVDKFPTDYHACKGLRKVVFGWGQNIINQTPEIKAILRKLMEAIFSLENPAQSPLYTSDIFEAVAISKPFKKMLSKELVETLEKHVVAIEKQHITHRSDPRTKLYAGLICKISLIVSTKIPFDFMDSIVKTIYNVYTKYAHIWTFLGSFRLWIMQSHIENVNHDLQAKLEAAEQAFGVCSKLIERHMEEDSHAGEQALGAFRAFESQAYSLLNCLQLKRIKENCSQQFYHKYFEFLFLLIARHDKWKGYWLSKDNELQGWANLGVNLGWELATIKNEFKTTIRYFLCNSSKVLHLREEEYIMSSVALLYKKAIDQNCEKAGTWRLINDILGISRNKHRSILQIKQILGPQNPYTSRFSQNIQMQDYVPFNFLSTLYASLRPNFTLLLRKVFGSKENQEAWQNLEKILFLPVTISGGCIFNGKLVEKSKEDMALGIYFEQYQKLTEVLTDSKEAKKNLEAILLLEKKDTIKRFLEVMRDKSKKIAEKARNIQGEGHRSRRMQQPLEEYYLHLSEMGVTREYAEIALENIEYPDHNLAIDWIDNNGNRLEEQLMMRVRQQSVNDLKSKQSQPQLKIGETVAELPMDKFRKETVACVKSWIKFVYKELFQSGVIGQIYKLKDILFLCMDYLEEKDKAKQFSNFNDKIYKDLDQLNKENAIEIKLKLLISIMETMVDKLPKSRALFYQKNINMKVISFLPRLKTSQDQAIVFSLLNSYLPIVTPDILTPELEQYLHYLLDLTYQYKVQSKAITSIFYKVAKCNKQPLIERITRNIIEYLSGNLIKESIVPILNIVFESDRQLSQVNAELDLKTFIYERYKHRISAFHPDKEHLLEMDIKEISISFNKYDKDGSIYEVMKQILSKKKGKTKYFYYDCRKEDNAFDYSIFAKDKFISYPLKEYQKTIVRSLVCMLIKSPPEGQEELLGQIHKILGYYRILIPFALKESVEGTSLLPWLLDSPNLSKRKYKLLVFLMLNCNILIRNGNGPYGFYSIGEFACAKAVAHLTTKNYEDGNYHSILSCYYLQQVRNFAEFCYGPMSSQNSKSLVNLMEELIEKATPMQYLAISELLNVQYKRVMLNNLRRKYKIVASQNEGSFQRQFLNLSPFYNSITLKKPEEKPKPSDLPLRYQMYEEEQSESDEQDPANLWGNRLQNPYLTAMRRADLQHQDIPPETIIAPLPVKPEKEGENEQVLEPIVLANNFTIAEVINLFEQYLSFDIEIQDKFPLVLAVVSNKTIKMNENLNFKANLVDANFDLQIRVRKNAGFQRHFVQIIHMINPKIIWEDKKAQPSNFERRVQQISRRVFSNENNAPMEYRQEMLHQLERLMIGRDHREEEQQPVRQLNMNEIYTAAAEFTEPIIPVVPQPEPMVIEPKPEEQIPIEPIVNNPPLEPVVNNIPQEPMDLQENIVQPQPIQPLIQNQPQQVQPIQVVHLPIHVEGEPQSSQIVEPQLQQILDVQSQPIQPVYIVPIDERPPPRDRQILRLYGLPQTFLRDAGIDEQSFDCLPQQFQQEQLMHLISQQNNAQNRARNEAPNTGNVVVDQQNENLAFLASLDMQTRAQVLIEAAPEFLNSLPPSIRQEAENYRHQQINRIIEQQDIEEEQKYRQQKLKTNIVYPKVKREQFSKISDSVATKLFEGIFYVYPNFKLSVIKILLENKQTQGKALATIIALLRYLQQKEPTKIFALKKLQMQGTQTKHVQSFKWTEQQTQSIRNTILHTVYQHSKIPFYKDEEFLSQKWPTQIYLPQLSHLLSGEETIEAQIELFEFALKYYPALGSELIKGIKELPQHLLVKIVEGIKKDSLPRDFYDNLENFSNNQKLKEIFNSYFQEQRPKIEVLGRLLKYNFSHVPYLRRVHQEAMELNSPSYYDFLNQIFRIYTVDTLQEVEPVLVKHKQIHFQVIKYLLQGGKEIEKEPIGILLKRPQLLDFQTKKFIFRNHPRMRKLSRQRVHIEVDRAHLFQGSYNQLMSRSLRELEGRIQVSFVNQPGYDAGGLKREWFLVVSREIFNQDYALFEKSSSGSTYQPNPKSYINPDHLNYFKFIGRFIGKALVERQLIDAYFTRAFYKMILGQQLQFKDLQAQDYEFYKSMEWLKNNPIDQNMFTFSYIYDNFGNRIEKELVPGGKEIIVNEENKKEYIEKYCLAKMRDDFSTQVGKFLEGFYEIVPQECISFFEAKELELLISGVPEVDLEDLKKNTDYSGYLPTDQIILWFWQIVQEYSQEDLAKLVQFITGTSKIPVEGFSQIVGMNGIQRISIHRDPCEHQLPKSHTCFNQLDLPNYASKQILKEKLGICLAWGSEGFGFM